MQAEMQAQAQRQLPKYKCHKEVWALKIKAVERHVPTIEELEEILNSESKVPVTIAPDGQIAAGVPLDDDKSTGAIITPEDENYAPFPVSVAYWHKHNPQPGGYYVVYADGYKSYSPAKAFEEGYTRTN